MVEFSNELYLSIYLATTSCLGNSLLESKVGRMDDREVKHFTIWEKVVLREKELCVHLISVLDIW
jgi:hypothetical protein